MKEGERNTPLPATPPHQMASRARILLFIIGLTACSVGPDFIPADSSNTTPTYSAGGDNLLSEDQRLVFGQSVQARWWELMQSPPLDDVLQRAFADNKDLAAARAVLTKAHEMVKAQRGNLWPHLGLGAMASRQDSSNDRYGAFTFNMPAFSFYEIGANASFTLDLFGGEQRKVEMREALADYQGYRLDAAYLSLSGQVVGQALNYAAARAQIATLERILHDDDETLRLARLSFQAGHNGQLDIAKLQAVRDADAALIPSLLQQEDISSHALSVLAGQAPGNWTPPIFDLKQFKLPTSLPVSLPSELAHGRPDIRAAEANLHAATAAIGAAEANLYPKITLSADALLTLMTPGSLWKDVNDIWALAAQIKAPLFEGGTLQAEKRAAEAAYQEALATYEQTVLQAFAQVADILRALQHDADETKKRKQVLSSEAHALYLMRLAHQEGEKDQTQVLIAERNYHQAALNLTSITAQRYLDTVQLFVALGGSRQAIEDTP